ncbi:MAG: hypothetical protein IJJ56_09010 [Prevotella sp.]|nr:hypothetical protein [Prevotella sp.]
MFAIMSCHNDEDSEKGTPIEQQECDSITTAFFNLVLPHSSYDHFSDGFFLIPEQFVSDTCYIINSREELESVYCEKWRKLPELGIDFSKSTLILGQHRVSSEVVVGRKERQTLRNTGTGYILYIYYEDCGRDGMDIGDPHVLYFWGVYPKLDKKSIQVKINI